MANPIVTSSASFSPFGYREGRLYKERVHSTWAKERLFQTCADYQYGINTPPLSNKNIILHCRQAEGFGDVSQTYLFAERIQKHYPDATITIAIQLESVSEAQVRATFPTDRFQTEFISKWDYSKATAQMKALRAKTGCMIGVAVPIFNPELLDGSPTRTIKEYGFGLHPNTKGETLSMGFDSSLEEGITFPTIEDRNLTQIETLWMKNALNIHTLEGQYHYLADRTLYHMYMPSWSTQLICLNTIVEIEKQDTKSIDVFMPVKHSLKDLQDWGALNVELLKENQIGKLVLVKPNGKEVLEIGPVGKEMRILSGSISKGDMHTIQKCSQPFFGCTGNLTFSEGILQDKLLIYDLLQHQNYFDKTWFKILQTQGWAHLENFKKVLHDYFLLETQILDKYVPRKLSYYQSEPSYELSDPDSVPRKAMKELAMEFPRSSKRMADLYRNPALLAESHSFNAHIKENYDCEHRIMEIVNRGLVLSNYPHLIQVENQLREQFIQGKLSEEEVVEMLSNQLKASTSSKL